MKSVKEKFSFMQDIDFEELSKETYRVDRENDNNFSYWFPRIKEISQFLIPETFYCVLPYEAYRMIDDLDGGGEKCRKKYEKFVSWLEENHGEEINKICREGGKVFVKNGRFSNKFDFNGCCFFASEFPCLDVARALGGINYASLCVGAGGFTELVIRRAVDVMFNNHRGTIYNGMPLKTEFRVFYDFDKKEIIGVANYWNYDYCKEHLSYTDNIVFRHEQKRIDEDYERFLPEVVKKIENSNIKNLDFSGKWSIDIMLQDGNKFWLIDMAKAENSAYWELFS